ncbi:unnamed protein product [Rotaria socialis]|uniref:Resistance to inhibitors of cholinesterase protein 3 N-terminal domain-containing protein n=1 Tax=Rotaria socialis TaxID=392032 RepID=A0A817T1T0_9BILA|nr:unnamed protein product [Rotaria socialis]CAF3359472.1 unnamed protein product [Rotaria socialis]CAF4132120.1 unnamed protein product [Rotaria socialis]CAF4206383.1 unnamed protein product [Rotaria socialis]
MSLLTRPSVVFAIVFGCFAVLVPRIFLPLFRSKPAVSQLHDFDESFQRPTPVVPNNENSDSIEHISGTPPHMRGAHPNMRMHHPGANGRHPGSSEQSGSKSIVTLALPMYTVGIGVFFIYTCFKYWSKKDCDGNKRKNRYSNENLPWNSEKRKNEYDLLDKDSEGEDNKEDFYSGLDPDYVEFLKLKKQKALEAERVMTDEQKQMHYALEEMKKSLSFISSKLVAKENRESLDNTEIVQLQERLASTEAQMCKILSALDVASEKVNTTIKTTNRSPKPAKEKNCCVSRSSSEDESNSDHNQCLSSSDEENPPDQVVEDEDDETQENHDE